MIEEKLETVGNCRSQDERRLYYRAYYLKNREKLSEYHREYYAKNREKILERQRRYRAKNREKCNQYSNNYYHWVKKNPGIQGKTKRLSA